MTKENISILAQKFLSGTASEDELILLHNWYDNWQDDEEVVVTDNEENLLKLRDKIFIAIKNRIDIPKKELAKTISIKRKWYFIAAAAALFIFAGLFLIKSDNQNVISAIKSLAQKNDIAAPKGTKAMIQLANGTSILLDSINSGTLANQGAIKVIKQPNGNIIYQGAGAEVSFNTLVNPRGGNVVNITLQDGSKIWLNSESSIKYPTAFLGKNRKIELTGEAYFEVVHNAAKPFIVSVNSLDIQVLGTHFNINAFNDEPSIKTTLLEGIVKVSKGSTNAILKPGQQAELNNGVFKIETVDVEETVAWKNGRFIFQGNNIQSVMRQLARWYDVDVKYEGKVTSEEFVGVISQDRYVDISKVLAMLEKTRTVSFNISGRSITVKPYKK